MINIRFSRYELGKILENSEKELEDLQNKIEESKLRQIKYSFSDSEKEYFKESINRNKVIISKIKEKLTQK